MGAASPKIWFIKLEPIEKLFLSIGWEVLQQSHLAQKGESKTSPHVFQAQGIMGRAFYLCI
jgi:hypothetical protein